MSKTMLIDAAHAEETRVVIVDGRQVEEFDFEAKARSDSFAAISISPRSRA